ncbi:hypothetical protein BsWGS_18091 [Bradybaena similaris]
MGSTKSDTSTEERGTWSSKLDFILSAVGFAVGLGNVWRFPYLAYKHGGASFLIPYLIMLFISGLPLFFIELAVGQFTSQGPMTCWKMAPIFTGIGYAMVIVSFIVCIYYNMIIAYAIYYMFVSFVNLDDQLPWENCGHWWNTQACKGSAFPRLADPKYNSTEKMRLLWNDLYKKTCVADKFNISTYSDYSNGTSAMFTSFTDGFYKLYNTTITSAADLTFTEVQGYDKFKECQYSYTTPSQEYFERYVLRQHLSEDIGHLGDISLKLVLTLLLSWFLVFCCIMKGIKTSGKVVYFTALFPYVILIVLLVRGVTLEGHLDGIKFYVIPKWDRLLDAKIWGDAASQIFYSLGIGFGGLLTMASYNKFNNNCYRDAILVSFINCGTSIFAGFAIFSLLGHMAFVTNKKVEEVAASGPGLAFIAYPDGISRLPASPVWAFLFFFMILTLGLDSQFAMMETVISALTDIFPRILRKRKTLFTLILCAVEFVLGIPLCTHGGMQVLTLINDYSGSYNLMIVALFELLCLCYVYGINKFRSDIEMMIGFKPNLYWTAMWLVVTPLAVTFIIIVSAIQYQPSGYNGKQFPVWAESIGWVMVGLPIVVIGVVGVVEICIYGWPACIKPLPDWGPVLPENRTGSRYAAVNNGFLHDEDSLHSYDTSKTHASENGFKTQTDAMFVSEKL